MKYSPIFLSVCGVIAVTVTSVRGSEIKFSTSSTSIKPPITRNLTLRCSLHDTSPSVSGGIVGRKKRDADDVTKVSSGIADQVTNRSSLTNTTANVDFVTSMVISKDGVDVATLSEHVTAMAVVTSTNIQVTGSLAGNSGEKAFLEISWPHPTIDQSGKYRCDVDTINRLGHSFDFSRTVEIVEDEILVSDLVRYVQAMEREKENMKKSEQMMNATIAKMNATINSLQQASDLLTSQINRRVFFSAGVTNSNNRIITKNSVLVFNEEFSSVGGGYDASTGVFTCPVAGYYYFSVNFESYGDKGIWFHLKHNDKTVLYITSSSGQGYQSSSNSGTVKLQRGDTVKVTSVSDGTQIHAPPGAPTTTFNGHLIAEA